MALRAHTPEKSGTAVSAALAGHSKAAAGIATIAKQTKDLFVEIRIFFSILITSVAASIAFP
jgi:hypothetical protein